MVCMVRLFLALRLLFADNMLWREMLVLFILRFTYSVIRCVSIAIYTIESLDPCLLYAVQRGFAVERSRWVPPVGEEILQYLYLSVIAMPTP